LRPHLRLSRQRVRRSPSRSRIISRVLPKPKPRCAATGTRSIASPFGRASCVTCRRSTPPDRSSGTGSVFRWSWPPSARYRRSPRREVSLWPVRPLNAASSPSSAPYRRRLSARHGRAEGHRAGRDRHGPWALAGVGTGRGTPGGARAGSGDSGSGNQERHRPRWVRRLDELDVSYVKALRAVTAAHELGAFPFLPEHLRL
jgi:hypothetical protein